MVQIILASHGGITTHYKQDIGRGWLHNGIDQGHTNKSAYDLQIMAPAGGIVTATGRQGTYGNRLAIRHDDGWRSLLAHHESQLVTVGQRITQGQIIAVMGNTGTKYVHSHQELWDGNGNQHDPLLCLGTSTGAASDKPISISTLDTLPAPKIEDYDMTIFYQPTDTSSPDKDGVSRIWNGGRVLSEIDYADVWAVSDIGEGRRLTRRHWVDLNAVAKDRGVALTVIQCTGNELEQIIFAPKF